MILDGKKIKEERVESLRKEVDSREIKPKLAIVQIGSIPESEIYVGQKIKFGEKIGVEVVVHKNDESVTDAELISKIEELNNDESVTGIITQLPVPSNINLDKVINSIDPKKDVDGLTAVNIRKLANNKEGENGMVPATARGILTLLKENKINVAGKKVLIIGRSLLVGKPTALLMLNNDATVTVAHSKTEDLSSAVKDADIVIVAVGKANLITEDMVNSDQVIVDVGINATGEGQMVGDVDFESIKDKVKAISPVPGGVGQMTVLSLFENLLEV